MSLAIELACDESYESRIVVVIVEVKVEVEVIVEVEVEVRSGIQR
jgi:hypothetical protein